MARPIFDVCVVGSGPGGGITAYALARAGASVALVESGRRFRPGVDYGAHGSVHQHLDHRLAAGRSTLFRVTDFSERNHFTPVGDRPAHGMLRALGGRSLCWAGHSLRFGPLDFKTWPISYDEVAPYYSRAERLMRVHGYRDGLSNLPDGEFLKGVPLRCGERMLKRGVERLKTKGRTMEFVAQRKAMATEPVRGYAQCHYCGHCMAGCEVDAKYTSANTPIPLAAQDRKVDGVYRSNDDAPPHEGRAARRWNRVHAGQRRSGGDSFARAGAVVQRCGIGTATSD
jgi:choline dehydrogenase-like flavoprotein